LCRLNKLGIYLGSKKQQALLRGDTSGTIINPFFIYVAQSLGMYFCEGIGSSPAMIRLQAKHGQACLESLAVIFRGRDWELWAQAALFVAAGSIMIPVDVALHYIQKGYEAVDMGGLRFIPTYGRPREWSEDLHEKFSVLSQIIYFENFLFLTRGGAKPTATARIEKEFRYQLQVQPVSSSPLTPRVQRSLVGSLSGVLQHLSVSHAH